MAKKKAVKQQVHSIFCPNCGVPRNARMELKKYMKGRQRVKFACSACGLICDFTKPNLGKKKEEKKEEDFTMTAKEIKGVGKVVKGLGQLMK